MEWLRVLLGASWLIRKFMMVLSAQSWLRAQARAA
jgi:hypothetical protein